MSIAVISDLHLGPGDASDSFGHSDSEFVRFLVRLENDFEHIVLLGDIWETLTSLRPFEAAEGLRRAHEAHPEIAQRFETPKYMYVHGNHDMIAGNLLSAPDHLLLERDGVRLLFTHGHHHDWLIRRARWLSEIIVWVGAWVKRVGLSAVYQLVYWADLVLSRPTDEPLRDSFQRWAFALAHKQSADVVVTGHTHHAMRSEHRAHLFLNSGCCVDGHLSYLAIDTRAGIYDVCTVE